MAFKKLRSDATGVTYADPSDPDYTVRFKFSNSVKSLSGNPVQNNVCEIIVNDIYNVVLGSETVQEALSIRLKVSGSHHSAARKKAMLSALAGKLDTWAMEDVLEGFEPTSVPVAPV